MRPESFDLRTESWLMTLEFCRALMERLANGKPEKTFDPIADLTDFTVV